MMLSFVLDLDASNQAPVLRPECPYCPTDIARLHVIYLDLTPQSRTTENAADTPKRSRDQGLGLGLEPAQREPHTKQSVGTLTIVNCMCVRTRC